MQSVSVAATFSAALIFTDEFDNPTSPPTLTSPPMWSADTDVTLTPSVDGFSVDVQANAPVVPITVLTVTYDTGSGLQTAQTEPIEWLPVSSPQKASVKLTMPTV